MFWLSAAMTFTVTLLLWRAYHQLKANGDALAPACLAATVFGVIGTLCFVAAALIGLTWRLP